MSSPSEIQPLMYDDVCRRYFELFVLQCQYGGGNHVIVTSEPHEAAVEFVDWLIRAQHFEWLDAMEVPHEYIVVIEPTLELAAEHASSFAQGFQSQTHGLCVLEPSSSRIVTVPVTPPWSEWADPSDSINFSVVFTTLEMREHDMQRCWSGYPSLMLCAHSGLLDQPQIEKIGFGSGHCVTFRQVAPPSPPPACETRCVGVAPAIGKYSRCMCHITTVPMFE
jgi:hypothetical protein